MTDDRHAATRDYVRILSDRAWAGLRNSQDLRPPLIDERGRRFGRPRLRLFRDAAGLHDHEPHTLTVFQPFDDVPPLLRRAVWKEARDLRPLREFAERRTLERLPEPRPTIEVRDRGIDRSAFETLLDQARDLRVPVVWPWRADRDSLTTDVGTVGFEYFDLPEPQAGIRCSWSADLPPGWEPIAEWCGRAIEWLESHFDGR